MDFIPARQHGPAANFPIMRIVMHGTVSPCVAGGARDVAKMFKNSNRDASTQYVVDPSEVIQCVKDDTIAYGAPPNKGAIHVEQCDPQAGDRSRWRDANHQAMLRLAAQLVAKLCLKYDIPIRKIDSSDLLAGRKGICGHKDVSLAWHQTDHVDPGPDYPWDQFISLVKQYANPAPIPAPTRKGKMRLIQPGGPGNPIYVTDGMKIRWVRADGFASGGDAIAYLQGFMSSVLGIADTDVHAHDPAKVHVYGVLDGPDAPNSVIVWP